MPLRSRSSSSEVVGLDIQPGEIVAAQVRRGGTLAVERVVAAPIEAGVVRDGEIEDIDALGASLKDLFAEHRLPSRVRVGLASQRAVMRTLDLPPLESEKDIEAALRMQAADHIAMPLTQAVMDHHSLGFVDTSDGRRLRVVVAAAQRDSIERLLAALKGANLRPEGVDLSAFALVRGTYAAAASEHASDDAPVLYAQIAGVTTLAIARGTACELTRVAPVGVEVLTQRLAEREGIVLDAARARLLEYGREPGDDDAALAVLDHGLAELADDLRNTVEFHAGQLGGTPVEDIVITGCAAAIPNVDRVLSERVGMPVRCVAPLEATPGAFGDVSPVHATVAAGLAVEEVTA